MWLSIENFMEVFVKKFNLKQDSIELGRSVCFFGAMKKLNPVLFRFCCFYSKKSLVEGFNRLISYYKNLKDAVQDICLSFVQPYDLSKWLYANNIYASVRAGYSINFVFNQTDMIRIDCIYKLKKIKKAWATEND